MEEVISLNFDQLVKSELDRDIGMMKAKSDQEIEAERMAEMARKKKSVRRRYTYETVVDKVDDNPEIFQFNADVNPGGSDAFSACLWATLQGWLGRVPGAHSVHETGVDDAQWQGYSRGGSCGAV